MDESTGGGLLRPDRRYVIAQTVSEEHSAASGADEAGGGGDVGGDASGTASATASGSSTSGSDKSSGSPSRRKIRMSGPIGDMNAMNLSMDEQEDEAMSGATTGLEEHSSTDDGEHEAVQNKAGGLAVVSPKGDDLDQEGDLDDVRELGDGANRGISCFLLCCICCCCIPAIITAIVLSIYFTRGFGNRGDEPKVVASDGTVLDVGWSPTSVPSVSPVALPVITNSPVVAVTPSPVAIATASPIGTPTTSPTASPTASPVASPTASPVASPTASPVASPTASPVANPTSSPVADPTPSPTKAPTVSPVAAPTPSPTASPTASPVAAPTTSPVASSPMSDQDFLLAVLTFHTERSILLDDSTPQGKAFEQLLTDVPNESDPRVLSQRYALMTLAFSTKVNGWRRRFGWNGFGDDICLWAGVVTCRNIDGYMAVANLDLSKNNLVGKIPSEICILGDKLEALDLSVNKINGKIPECVTKFVKLETFSLAENRLSGPLPKGLLATLSLLQTVDLSFNRLEDGLDILFDSSIDAKSNELEVVNLVNNELTGTIPMDFKDFPSLISLHVWDNFLSGEVGLCALMDPPSDIQVDCDTVTCTCCSNCI